MLIWYCLIFCYSLINLKTIISFYLLECLALNFSLLVFFDYQWKYLGLHISVWIHLWVCLCSIGWICTQFSSVQSLSCVRLCDPMNHSTPGLPVNHHLPELTQTHVHRVGDAIQPSHPLSSPSPPALNPSQHQSLFQWVNPSHEVAKVLKFQLQPQSFQWIPRTDLL